MIDVAQAKMANGSRTAVAAVSENNDNMSQSHYHDYFEMYFLDRGNRYHLMDDKLFEMQTGDCIIFPPQTMHRSYGDPNMAFSRTVIYFRPESIHSPELLDKLTHSNSVYRPELESLRKLRRYIYTLLEEQDSVMDDHEAYMEDLINLIMIETLRMKQEACGIIRGNRITEVIQYLHTHYAEEITLKLLSDKFYVSEYHLCREFKKNTNRTIVEYLNQTRIMNAKRLFMETNQNVTDTAHDTGFTNLTHFNRVFREFEGISPSQYRKQCHQLHN